MLAGLFFPALLHGSSLPRLHEQRLSSGPKTGRDDSGGRFGTHPPSLVYLAWGSWIRLPGPRVCTSYGSGMEIALCPQSHGQYRFGTRRRVSPRLPTNQRRAPKLGAVLLEPADSPASRSAKSIVSSPPGRAAPQQSCSLFTPVSGRAAAECMSAAAHWPRRGGRSTRATTQLRDGALVCRRTDRECLHFTRASNSGRHLPSSVHALSWSIRVSLTNTSSRHTAPTVAILSSSEASSCRSAEASRAYMIRRAPRGT